MTNTWDDEGISRLVGVGGMAGLALYGLWQRTFDIVAAQVGPREQKNSATYPISKWASLLSIRGSLAFSTLSRLGVTGGVTVERHADDITVTFHNLLKYRDEYSRKSGVAPDTNKEEEQIEIESSGGKEHLANTNSRGSKASLIARSVSPEELAGTLPLIDGTFHRVSKQELAEWAVAYPAVDVAQQLNAMRAWLNANSQNRKTPRGINRFIVSWLSREQNRARVNGGTNGHRYLSKGELAQQACDEAIGELFAELGAGADEPGNPAPGPARQK